MLSIPDLQFFPRYQQIDTAEGSSNVPNWHLSGIADDLQNAYVGGTDHNSPVRLMADIVRGRVVRINVMGPFRGMSATLVLNAYDF